jgi:uncharacterized protein with LGFP repeats
MEGRVSLSGFQVGGAIGDKWVSLLRERGPMGAPTSNEHDDGFGGRVSNFAGGVIAWSFGTGAHTESYPIFTKWLDLERHHVDLGHPTSDVIPLRNGGQFVDFQGGAIYCSPATGAHEVHGAILGRYRDLGGPGSPLGLPTSDELPNGDGRLSWFQYGRIDWTFWGGAREHGVSVVS